MLSAIRDGRGRTQEWDWLLSPLNKSKMLKGIQFDLNSVQFCSDSLKGRLKQMMLNQELVFMGQVFELHQLYRIQAAMAEDTKQRGLYNYNAHVRGVYSSPVSLNNQVKYSMSDIQSSTVGFKHKPLDLQLSADEFIHQSSNASLGDSPLKLMNMDATTLDLNLSLNIGEEHSKKGGEHRPRMGKGTWSPGHEIIDLEDPNSKDSNIGFVPPSGSKAPNSSFKGNHMLERSINIEKHTLQSFSKSGNKYVGHGCTSSRPFINADHVDQTSQRQTLCDSGLNGGVVASDTPIPHRPGLLDLNTVQLDDLSDFSITHSGLVNSLETAFSSVTEKVKSEPILTTKRALDVNNSAEIPDTHVQSNRKFGNTVNVGSKPEDNKGKIIFIDIDSDSEPQIESVGSSSQLSNCLSSEGETGEAGGPEAGIEKDPEPLCPNSFVTEQLSVQKLSNSSELECVIDLQACSTKTMQSGVNAGDSNFSAPDQSEMVHLGPEQRASENADSNALYIKGKIPEVGEMEQKAAELLVQISIQDLYPKVSVRKGHDMPQHSSDSYEEMMLGAKECGPDEYCVSSNAFEVDVSEKKDSRYKLKRGTRMKDFQKDILSSLSTLSRHEIREDINLLEGVIRSREYKKMRAKITADEDDWCKPKKSKRSRIGR